MPSSSELALIRKCPPTPYKDLQALIKAIADLHKRLETGDVSQYLSFKDVSLKDFRFIESHRKKLGSAVRFTYYPEISTLVLKVVTSTTETVHDSLYYNISSKLANMDIDIDQFVSLGASEFEGPWGSIKEGDGAFKNPVVRSDKRHWPSFVIESAVSDESMPRLRQDAAWWIANSVGEVQVVLIINVLMKTKYIVLEKYGPEDQKSHNTRSQSKGGPNDYRPVLKSRTTVNYGAGSPHVEGDSVKLKFKDLMGRPKGSSEEDVEIGHTELLELAKSVFGN
ncbi:hypothetical protein AtubIFM56815_007626 [Aspergillus tubingensis]|uniref:Uncharacterized protein n=2 Tax=Aspergillus subgen. Circumdati TaxID=2720871 RepID=A0A117DZC0_ASPNG|nr:hypothetical protein AKAW_03468 [Aspergillus niger]GLA59371.1 hypothetical protein AtubIFM54640_010491 [Aspergillus tubingensis]GLA83433.1 hypothetical protein AtubIFM56815_007626 [Aspergillus tubingensis]GLA97393.1 hypothetical protein AtubIFM57143_004885 [Aspergillus tubingensis]